MTHPLHPPRRTRIATVLAAMACLILAGCSDSGTDASKDAPAGEDVPAAPPPVALGENPAVDAAELSRKGNHLAAAGLLRAAVAASPADRNLRLAAAQACAAAAAVPIPGATNEDLLRGSPHIDDEAAVRAQAYLDAVNHVTYLIRGQLVDAELALRLCDSLSTRHLARSFPKAFDPATRTAVYWAAPRRAAIEQAKESFLLTTFPQVLALSVTRRPGVPDFRTRFQQSLILAATHRIDAAFRSPAHLEHVRLVLTTVLPDHVILASDAPAFLVQAPLASAGPNDEPMPRAQWMQFLATLNQPTHAVARIYGRHAALWLESEALLRGESPQSIPAWIAAADQLLTEIEALPYIPAQPAAFRGEDPLHRQLLNQRNTVARLAAPAVAQRAAPMRPVVATPPPNPTGRPRRIAATPAGVGTIRFERIEPIKVQTLPSAYKPPHFTYLTDRAVLGTARYPFGGGGSGYPWHQLACRDFDVLWHGGVLLFIRQRGLAREAFVDSRPGIVRLVWDGKYVWAATMDMGVWAMDVQGKIVAQFDQTTGLPEYDKRSVQLQPLSPGKVLVIANRPKAERVWIAALNASTAAPDPVTIIHEANEPITKTTWRSESHHDTKWGFYVSWTHRVEGARGHGPVILVGRPTRATTEAPYPLAINPDTLKVTTFRHALFASPFSPGDALHSKDGRLFMNLHSVMWVVEAFEDKPLIKVPIRGNHSRNDTPQVWLLPQDEWIYLHGRGSWWWRVHTAKLTTEELFIADESQRDIASWSGVSSFYGVMLLDHARGIYYRPVVEPAPRSP